MKNIDIQLLERNLDSAEAEAFVTNENCGGIVTFVGTVRKFTKGKEVQRLEFEAYEPMAIKEMTKIANQILEKYPAFRIAIHHRVGILPLKGIAVVISVACPHRKDAFAACQFAIDTLKETVPIWKKEIFTDGEVWVAAHP
ncbi:MAG: molybdenum cofactor biosynthesis protein MoaE [Saprospiraceae bacterium]